METIRQVKEQNSTQFENVYNNPVRATSYNQLEFPNTYYLAYRDLPDIINKHTNRGNAIDFGCGTGRSSRFLKRLGFEVVGVDIAKDMVNLALKNDPVGDYRVVENGTIGNFEMNSIDLILSVFTFDNLPGADIRMGILQKMKHVLNENGRVIMLDSTPELYVNDWASFTCSIFPKNKQAKSGDVVKVRMEDVPDKRPVEDVIWFKEDYSELFLRTGMELEAVYYPLALDEEPFDWKNETQIAPWVIYILKKDRIISPGMMPY